MYKIILLSLFLLISCGKGKIKGDASGTYLYMQKYQNVVCINCLYVKVNQRSLSFIFNDTGIESCEKDFVANVQTSEVIKLPEEDQDEITLTGQNDIQSDNCSFDTLNITIKKNNSQYELLMDGKIFTFIKTEG